MVSMYVSEVSILLQPFATHIQSNVHDTEFILHVRNLHLFISHPQCRHHAQVHVSSALDGESERLFHFMLHLIIVKVSNELPLTIKKKKKEKVKIKQSNYTCDTLLCVSVLFFCFPFFFLFRFIILAFNFAYLYYFRIEEQKMKKKQQK